MAEVLRSVPCGECVRAPIRILAWTLDAEHEEIHWGVIHEVCIKRDRGSEWAVRDRERQRERESERESERETEGN